MKDIQRQIGTGGARGILPDTIQGNVSGSGVASMDLQSQLPPEQSCSWQWIMDGFQNGIRDMN